MSSTVMGYTEEVDFCPFCGEEISERWSNGKHECGSCGAKFYVVEDDDSQRETD
ncbi:MAG: hypothetical protein J5959_02860 [Butyrivibrio sp.]|nr:hypothetical protein [Butyrivibrio sp.]